MNLNDFYPLALLGIATGLTGFICVTELFTPGRILNGYFNWLSRAVGPEAPMYGRKRRDWLFKPLGSCLACFSGQLGLWAYVLSLPGPLAFHPGHAILTVCGSIFVATQLNTRCSPN